MRNPKKFKELSDSVNLIVHTRSPEKWILLDKETGETYQGNNGGYWDRLDPVIKNKP
jgi:hypothetical protein